MKMFEPGRRSALLRQVSSDPTYQRSALLARAEYHQLVGEYLDAKEIYRRFFDAMRRITTCACR